MPQIDYRAVREACSLEQVIDRLGIPLCYRGGGRARGGCPLRCSESERVCSYQLYRNLWHCFKCCQGGNQLDLFAHVKGLPLWEAAKELCRLLNVNVPWIAT